MGGTFLQEIKKFAAQIFYLIITFYKNRTPVFGKLSFPKSVERSVVTIALFWRDLGPFSSRPIQASGPGQT